MNSAGAVIAGCVPINPLGGLGSISQEALDYTSFTAHDSASLVSKGYYANISGEIVQLPAGALGFAAGYEYRKETGQFDPDAFIASGLSTGNGAAPTKGGYDLNEFFVELSIPVLADLPGAKLLDFSVASRYSDYSNFGNTTNNKFGFRWKPIDDLMIRGNYSEGFRAPSINNLYRGDTDSFETYIDPCSSNAGLRTGAVAAQCAAQGVPANFIQPGAGAGRKQTVVPFTWQANPNLKPETSTSKTLGLVWSPSFVTGLNVTLDWWQIKVEDAITRPAIQDIMSYCYGGTPQQQAAYCGLITRDPNYGTVNQRYTITNVNMPLQNLASYKVEGWDLGLAYRLPETSFGQFTISWDSTYLSKWDTKSTQDSPVEGRQGRYRDQDPYWRIRSNLYVDWSYGDFGVNWGLRYKSGMREECPFSPTQDPETFPYCSDGAKGENHIASTTYHDIQVRYNTPWKGTIMLGLNNAFDKDPPVSYSVRANMFDPQYDLPGRYMYMQYKQKF